VVKKNKQESLRKDKNNEEKVVVENTQKEYYLLKIFIPLFVSLIIIEGIFKVISFGSIFVVEFIRIILFSLVLALSLSGILRLFKPKVSKIVNLILIFLAGLYALVQLTFQNMIGNFMSLNAASNNGLTRVIGDQLINFIGAIKIEYLTVFIPFIIFLVLYIVFRKRISYSKIVFWHVPVYIAIILIIHLLSMATLNMKLFNDANQIKSNKDLYKQPNLLELSLKQFGVIRFLERDFVYMINPVETHKLNMESNQVFNGGDEDYKRKIDDSAWIEKMNSRENKTIKELDQWFMNQNITDKNEYTGYFKDKNVVMIMIEAFDIIAINEEVTPTLYKMMNEGWYFDNYYAPIYSCATGESEYISETSVVPSLTVCTPNSYINNNYYTSIFNLFNKSNYYTSSYHNYIDQYYSRTKLHANMGSQLYLEMEGLGIKNQSSGWPSDLELFEKSYDYYSKQDKFFTFVITSSTHFPYDYDTSLTRKYWDQVKDLPYSNDVKRYIAKAIDLDNGLKYLIDSLEKDGKLDDTVFIMFGDHHPLNMSFRDINSASPVDRLEDFNINLMPMIIYNSESDSKVISDVSSTFDLVPTIANLFDLEYDPRDYIGKDILSDEEHIVVMANGSWITDLGYYNASSNKYKSFTDEDMNQEYIDSINARVKDYFYVSDKILTLDYFEYKYGD